MTSIATQTKNNSINKHVAEEAFLIEHSGELPEVAYYNSIYYLCEDKDGPMLNLSEEDLLALKKAVIKQYLKIIKRDLTPSNKEKRIYRGIERAWVNWNRLLNFTKKFNIDISDAKAIIKQQLISFLENEIQELSSGKKVNLNISKEDLSNFLKGLDITGKTIEQIEKNLFPVLK